MTLLLIALITSTFFLQAQTPKNNQNVLAIQDTLYREDHLYFGIGHALLANPPSGFVSNGISPYVHLGYIRDIPLNTQRNHSIGLGAGYQYETHNNNLIVINPATNDYIIDNQKTFNRMINHSIEFPIEYRWRTSTISSYKFWRIYTGFRYSYLLRNTSQYKGYYGNINLTNNPDLTKHQLKYYLSFGYNNWNFYGSINIFRTFKKEQTPYNESLRAIQIGIIFYIL